MRWLHPLHLGEGVSGGQAAPQQGGGGGRAGGEQGELCRVPVILQVRLGGGVEVGEVMAGGEGDGRWSR